MKQQVQEHFEMRAALREDERSPLDQVTRGWETHLGQVGRAADAVRRALRRGAEGEDAGHKGVEEVSVAAQKESLRERTKMCFFVGGLKRRSA